MDNGLFITIEGGEGSGKSTAIKGIRQELEDRGYQVLVTREPGGVDISEKIRNILVHEEMDGLTEAMLFAASRHEVVRNVIKPALNEGYIVICDRYVDSSLVYQGFVRNVGMDRVYELNEMVIRGCIPDLTLYFDIDPTIGLNRIASNKRDTNKFEDEKIDFHRKVRRGYQLLSNHPDFNERIRTIHADKSKGEVLQDSLSLIEKMLKKKRRYLLKRTLS